LSLITHTSVGEVFRGYLPSGAIIQRDGYVDFSYSLALELTLVVSFKPVVFSELPLCHTVSI
jgi:hypothetical protein